MNANVATPQALAAPQNLRELAEAVVSWLKKNLPQAIFSALIGAAIGYAVNFLLLAFWYNGFEKTSDGMATGHGNVMSGSLFWALGSTTLFTLYGYRRTVGKEKFWNDVRNLPATVETLFQQDGHSARLHLFWGAAVSMFASLVISPSVAGVIAVGLIASAPSLIGRILSTLLYQAWLSLVRRFAPGKNQPLNGPISMTVGLLGTAAALGIAFFIDGWMYRLVLAVVCAAIAWTQGSPGKPAAGVSALFVWLGFGFLFLWAFPSLAWANDSGAREEDGGIMQWIKNGGPWVLAPWAVPGSVAAAVGAPVGRGLGHILGRLPGGPLPGSDAGTVTPTPPPSAGPIKDPWTGKPLTTWKPGQYAPGSDGNPGGPGTVWWGGNWVDPATARQGIAAGQAADAQRAQQATQFNAQSQQMSGQATHERAVQLQNQADARAANQAEIDRLQAAIDKPATANPATDHLRVHMRDDATARQWGAIDRVLEAVNRGGPTPENIAALRTLVHNLGVVERTQSTGQSANWTDFANAIESKENIATNIARVGQAAAGYAENALLPGSRGFFSGLIYGAAQSRGKSVGEMVANASLSALGNVVSAGASEVTAGNRGLNILANTGVGAGVGGGTEIIKGSSRDQVREAAGWGGLLGGTFSAISHVSEALHTSSCGVVPHEGPIEPGGPRPYTDAPLSPRSGPSVPHEGPILPGGPRPYTDAPLPPPPDPSVPNEGPVQPGGPRPFTNEPLPGPGHKGIKPPERRYTDPEPAGMIPQDPTGGPSDHELRGAVAAQQAAGERIIPVSGQSHRIQKLAGSITYENSTTVEHGQTVPVIKSYVNTQGALEQLTDTAASRTGKQAPVDVREAIINTRVERLYAPADQATIHVVGQKPEVQAMLRPGDKLVMDSFQTPVKPGQPAKPVSLGADRDARLVIQHADGTKSEINRSLWENQAYSDFYKHTMDIYNQGGGLPPATEARIAQRVHEMQYLKGKGLTDEQILHRAYADEHNQLFTDKHHVEASSDNSDQWTRGTVQGSTVGTTHYQSTASVILAQDGKGPLQDPHGYARMWGEKSHFYHNNPPEALAQSQKGIAEMLKLRNGYQQAHLTPPPLPSAVAKAMDVIIKAPTGVDATPTAMANVDAKLQLLGFKNMHEAMNKIASQNELLKWSKPTPKGRS